jgi:N4-gp56 family major capsid protein
MIPVDPVAAERVGWNAGVSIDTIARTALDAATNTVGGGAGTMGSELLRQGVYEMKAANVRPFAGGSYVAVISPKQEQALKAEADAAGWRWVVGQNPAAGNSIYMGEVGTYEGVRIVVNNHLTDEDTGYLLGAEGLAKAYSSAPGFGPNPRVVVSPVVDKLRRFASVGWHHLVGYKIFRESAVRLINTSS